MDKDDHEAAVRDLATKEGAETFAKVMMQSAQMFFNAHGWHPLVAYVLVTKEISPDQPVPPGEIGIVQLLADKVEGNIDSESFAQLTRAIVERGRAVGVLSIMEVWRVEAATNEEAAQVRAMNDLTKHPARRESLAVSLEHIRTNGYWLGDIHRTADVGHVETFERAGNGLFEGRFAGLLCKERFA